MGSDALAFLGTVKIFPLNGLGTLFFTYVIRIRKKTTLSGHEIPLNFSTLLSHRTRFGQAYGTVLLIFPPDLSHKPVTNLASRFSHPDGSSTKMRNSHTKFTARVSLVNKKGIRRPKTVMPIGLPNLLVCQGPKLKLFVTIPYSLASSSSFFNVSIIVSATCTGIPMARKSSKAASFIFLTEPKCLISCLFRFSPTPGMSSKME